MQFQTNLEKQDSYLQIRIWKPQFHGFWSKFYKIQNMYCKTLINIIIIIIIIIVVNRFCFSRFYSFGKRIYSFK